MYLNEYTCHYMWVHVETHVGVLRIVQIEARIILLYVSKRI